MCHISIDLKERTVRPGSKVQGTLNIDFPTGLIAVKQIKLELIGVSGVKSGGCHRGTIPVTSSYTSYDENVVLKKLGANTAPFDRTTRLYYDARTIYPPATLLDNAQEFEEARTNYAVGSSISENFEFVLSAHPLEVPIPPEHPQVSPLLGPPSKHAGSLPGPKKESGKIPLPPTFMFEPRSRSLNYAVVQYYIYVSVNSGSGDFEKKVPLKMCEPMQETLNVKKEKKKEAEMEWTACTVFDLPESRLMRRWNYIKGLARGYFSKMVILFGMPAGPLKGGEHVTPTVYLFVDNECGFERIYLMKKVWIVFFESTTFMPRATDVPPARWRFTTAVNKCRVCWPRLNRDKFKPVSELDIVLPSSITGRCSLDGLNFVSNVSDWFPPFDVPVPKGPCVLTSEVEHLNAIQIHVKVSRDCNIQSPSLRLVGTFPVLGPVDHPEACARLIETVEADDGRLWWLRSNGEVESTECHAGDSWSHRLV